MPSLQKCYNNDIYEKKILLYLHYVFYSYNFINIK